MSKKVRTQIMLDKDLKDALYQYAKKNDISMGRVVRDALGSYMEDMSDVRKKKKEKYKGAGDFFLKTRDELGFKGPKDLSTTIDKHVYDL